MQRREFLLATRLEAHVLEAWIEAGWLMPRRQHQDDPFSDIDVARAQLIRDLEQLGANAEAIPIILDLLDQLHGLRRTLRHLLAQAGTPPEGQHRRRRNARPSKRRSRA